MYKFLKFFTVFIIIFSFVLTVYSNISLATNTADDLPTEDYLSSGVSSVQRVSSIPEANLGLNNILNVILIAIGVLLILFAIAILIRLKH
ncbi:MAG: hypothetical protein HFJ46_05185 [Clostridia bacterium]|nr:hypothetical protein [Clostridia bacterium]